MKIQTTGMILLILTLSLLVYGCSEKQQEDKTIDNSTILNNTIIENNNTIIEKTNVSLSSNVVDSNNQFAFDLYSKYSSEEKNIFFSPFSISSALAMTYEGARGQTAAEMQRVLHLPNDIEKVRSGYAEIYREINMADKPYKLSTANALWAQKDYSFLDAYLNTVDKYYDGKTTNLDFKTDTENSRITINNWVANKTDDKIKDLIPQGVLLPETRLVLTNAIYFKSNWSLQFDNASTTDQIFKSDSGTNVNVRMMHNTKYFAYGETKDMQIIELPYSNNDLSMLVILPKTSLNDLEKSFTLSNLNDWKKNMNTTEVELSLPKFKFETKYFMADKLGELGMTTALSSSADFSGMTGKKDLYINQVIHQAYIDVTESGTEAAAATAVLMVAGSLPPQDKPKPKIFNADHPFIFLIQERNSGNILFMGRMIDPTLS
jgi:serpin B